MARTLHRAIQLSSLDNVATVLAQIAPSALVTVLLDGAPSRDVVSVETIPLGHKVSLETIARGTSVIKWGEKIGVATAEIRRGEHVHIHNVASERGRGDLSLDEA